MSVATLAALKAAPVIATATITLVAVCYVLYLLMADFSETPLLADFSETPLLDRILAFFGLMRIAYGIVPPPMMAPMPRSPHWPAVRKAWLAEHPTCRACGGTEDVQVHHKRPFHLHPELELDSRNFITLCENPSRLCHFIFGHGGNWLQFNRDVEIDATRTLTMYNRVRGDKVET